MGTKLQAVRRRAFSLVELLVVIAIIGILAALLLPSLGRSMRQANRTACLNNLRQIGIAFQQFADDHANHYPMQVSAAAGGAAEATANARDRIGFLALAHENFPAVERELVTPKLLVCRAEKRMFAEDFASLRNEHVSYLLATNAVPGRSDSVLATDRNLVVQPATGPGGDTNITLIFDATQHQWRGNVLLADGHVEWLRGLAFRPTPPPPSIIQPAEVTPGVTHIPGQPGLPPAKEPPASSPPTVTTLPTSPQPTPGGLIPPTAAATETNVAKQAGPPSLVPLTPDAPAVSFIPVQPGQDVGRSSWWWWLLLLLIIGGWLYFRSRRTADNDEEEPRRVPGGLTMTNAVAPCGALVQAGGVKQFFTGAAVNADLLVTMLEKHNIAAKLEFAHAEERASEDEFSRETLVFVPEADYDRAHQLFYSERGDEL